MLAYDFLMSMPIDYLNFMSYAPYKTSYRDLLRKWSIFDQNQNSFGIKHKTIKEFN